MSDYWHFLMKAYQILLDFKLDITFKMKLPYAFHSWKMPWTHNRRTSHVKQMYFMRRLLGLYMYGIGPTGYEFYFLAYPMASFERLTHCEAWGTCLKFRNPTAKAELGARTEQYPTLNWPMHQRWPLCSIATYFVVWMSHICTLRWTQFQDVKHVLWVPFKMNCYCI